MISTCLHHAVDIQRRRTPRDWSKALLGLPMECRAECEQYLRDIAARMRNQRSIKGGTIQGELI